MKPLIISWRDVGLGVVLVGTAGPRKQIFGGYVPRPAPALFGPSLLREMSSFPSPNPPTSLPRTEASEAVSQSKLFLFWAVHVRCLYPSNKES